MNKDPAGKLYLKDIKLHFRRWLIKINSIFSQVLNIFLNVNSDSSLSIESVGPFLDEVRADSEMM